MKYWNKRKKSREHWAIVKTSAAKFSYERLKLWCQRHPSNGKFFYFPHWKFSIVPTEYADSYTTWLFELPEDAVAFKLIYG